MAPEPSRMFPTAFSTTSAPTTMSPPLAAQLPTPPFVAARGPRAETIGRAAGEQDRVDAVDEVSGVQSVDLAGPRGAASHGAGGAHAALRPEHDAAPGGPLQVGPVSHGDTLHGGEAGGSGRRH